MDLSDTDFVDMDRRFGGIERLYGPQAFHVLRQSHVLVAGIGGVGSWCAEALARSGAGRLTLVDMDHVAESNINRQLHALTSTLGQAKVNAMADRIREINPHCRLGLVEDFVLPENVAELLAQDVDVVIDCTDQASAKIAMILEARRRKQALIVCGGAGGKTNSLSLKVGDIAHTTNDALLAKLRNTLRRLHGFPKAATQAGKIRRQAPRMGVRCLWFDQPAILPQQWLAPQPVELGGVGLQGLSCAGYGSLVTVTASMGMAAANDAIHWLLNKRFAT